MIPGIVVAVIALLAAAYVAAPLSTRRRIEEPPDPRADAEERKLAALTAILDLESERDVGKLSDEDLTELRVVYESEALAALGELDAVGHGDGTDALEREIARARARLEDEQTDR